MSAEEIVLVGAGAILAIAVVSGRLEGVWLTEPLVITGLGVIAGFALLDEPIDLETPLLLTFLELTLALVLFSDASRIDVARLRSGYTWPLRMLLIGMPVVIVLGAALAGWYLTLPLGIALLIGVLLAPTDAALAEPVLVAEKVPPRVRQAINIESGLNDGLAVPALLIAIGLIESETGQTGGEAAGLVMSQLGIGIVGGIVLGWLGARLIGTGTESGWMNPLHQKIAAVALALVGFAGVQLLGGSGFIAVFIAGGLMSHLIRPRCEYLYEFAEAEGHALVLVAFFIVGAGPGLTAIQEGLAPEAIVVALVSLLVLRPASIALALIGQRLSGATVAFLGWFGPRGLATVVFVLVAAEELEGVPPIVSETVTAVVLASIIAHGLSVVPMTSWLAARTAAMPEGMPEMGEAFDHPMRRVSGA
jgi:NhaP-type Na+/H+ or K+/H+ antiporter